MRGRSYTKELKESIIKEVKEVGNISLVSRKHGISKSAITTRIRNSKKKGNIKVKPGRKALIEGKNDFEQEITEITKENDTLKKTFGEKDLEIAILKDLLKNVDLYLNLVLRQI